MSELLDVRVIGAPEVADQAIARLRELLDLDRLHGPYPSRKTPGLARFYLTGRLLLTACQHGQGLDCPDCEPVPDLVRQALGGEAVRPA